MITPDEFDRRYGDHEDLEWAETMRIRMQRRMENKERYREITEMEKQRYRLDSENVPTSVFFWFWTIRCFMKS